MSSGTDICHAASNSCRWYYKRQTRHTRSFSRIRSFISL